MRVIWMMQPRFEKRVGTGPWSLVDQARFRAGSDFMRLRADVGEVSEALADWWQAFSTADDTTREDLLQQVRQSNTKAQRVRNDGEPTDAPAAKKRRRRRKPSGGTPSGDAHTGET